MWTGRPVNRGTHKMLSAATSPVQVALIFAITLIVLVACRNDPKIYYSADPITAQVVDAGTRLPLADVNVLAEWTAYGGGLEGGNLTGHTMVMEAVSDENGKFSLPGWGPKLRHFSGRIGSDAPLLVLFKSGYKSQGWSNGNVMDPAPFHMRSDWNGKVLELRKFEGSADEYAEQLRSYPGLQIRSLLMTDECNWRQIPKFLLALERQHQEFVLQHTKFNLQDLNELSASYSKNCGSLESYVRGHGK